MINRRKLLKTGLAATATSMAAISCSAKQKTATKNPTLITNKIKDVTLPNLKGNDIKSYLW